MPVTGDQPLPDELVPKPKPIKLTKARRRALEVLAERHGKQRCARVSNVTDPDEGLVYWQSAEWLVAQGLAAGIQDRWPSTYLRITAKGLEQVRS